MALEFQKICYLDNHKEELSDTAMETLHRISDLEGKIHQRSTIQEQQLFVNRSEQNEQYL